MGRIRLWTLTSRVGYKRITEEGVALVFTEVGLEAYEHLHNLVLLNTDDTEKVEQEFNTHLGLKKSGLVLGGSWREAIDFL